MKQGMSMMGVMVAVGMMLELGCGSKPTADDVCKKIEASGIGKNCREAAPKAVSARAKQKYEFTLANSSDKVGGQILSFEKKDDYDATVKVFEDMAMLSGPHRYGSERNLIFVHVSDKATLDDGKRTKEFVEQL